MKKLIDFRGEAINKLIFRLSLPAFFGIVINLLYGFIDGVIIGNGVGQEALGGITIIFPITIIVISFASLVGEGLASFVARGIASDKENDVLEAIGTGHKMTGVFSLILILVSSIFLSKVLVIIGTSVEVLPFAKDYYISLLPGLPFMGLSLVYFHQLNAQGEIKSVMKIMIISSVMNIILDYIGVYTFGLGVIGAGLATSISQLYWFMHMHIYSIKTKHILTISWPLTGKFNFKYVKPIVSIGMGSFIRQFGVSISLILINSIAGSYGSSIYVASFGATQRIFRLLISPIAAISTAFKPIVGQNYGYKNIDRVKETVKLSLIYSSILGFILLILLFLLKVKLGILFGIRSDQIEVFTKVLMFTTCLFPLYGIHHISVAYFSAIGRAKEAILLNLMKQVIFLIPLIFLLPKFFGVYGLFLVLPIADLLSIGISFLILKRNLDILS